jgi:hypothetical protein
MINFPEILQGLLTNFKDPMYVDGIDTALPGTEGNWNKQNTTLLLCVDH